MFDINDKRILYWLIELYLAHKINASNFCDNFHVSFVNEIDTSTFEDQEFVIFSILNDVVQRYSSSSSDLTLWPGFVNSEQLLKAVVKAKSELERMNI